MHTQFQNVAIGTIVGGIAASIFSTTLLLISGLRVQVFPRMERQETAPLPMCKLLRSGRKLRPVPLQRLNDAQNSSGTGLVAPCRLIDFESSPLFPG
jgi:hypothetical protein